MIRVLAFAFILSLLPVASPGADAVVATPADPPSRPFDQPFPVPEMTPKRADVRPFEYIDVGKKIPNYLPGKTKDEREGEMFSQMPKPLPPEESRKHMVVPKGFRVELFASEPEIGGKPICMNWDERGRLWVAETVDYPNQLQPPSQGHDRIRIFEDTDGDGKADRNTVFADELSIPTSLLFSRGGVIVHDGTRTIFLRDTDGDDVADERKILFGTWAQNDTHGGPSNMQYGLDNWIWGMQGYNNSRLTLGGETTQFRQGFYRFKPDGSELEFIRSTNNNTWGLGLSEEGIIFGSTANRNPSVYMPIPNRYYEAVRGWATSLVLPTIADSFLFRAITDRVRQVDAHGGYTAPAGHSLYTARRYPKAYWNRVAFVAEPTGHLVGTFVLRSEGSHFRSSNPFNLLASDDEWTAPIMAEVGPDGNVWVIDWYNYIVQHNPTPRGFQTGKGAAYESDLRDKTHGRIYRIVPEGDEPGREKDARPSLAGATPRELVATLKNDNLFWRRHAQRLLVERGRRDVVPALCALARDPGVDEIGLNVGAIHALWTMHGLGALDGSDAEAKAVALAALGHRSADVRRNAVQVLPRSAGSVAALLEAGLVHDPAPQVRLLTLLAPADQPPGPAVGAVIVAALGDPKNGDDRWLPDAATCAAANNSEHFLQALTAAKEPSGKLLAVSTIVAEHYARGGPVESVGAVIGRLADADPRVADAVVVGLAKGWPAQQRPRLEERLKRDLERLAARFSPERRGLLIRLASTWGSKTLDKQAAEVSRSLLARVEDESLPTGVRIAAARTLLAQRAADAEAARSLLGLITPRTSPDLAAGLLGALQLSEVADAGRLILERLPGLAPSARSAAIGVLLDRSEWTKALLDDLEKAKVPMSDLALDQKRALAEHPDRAIRRRAEALLQRGGVLPDPDRQKILDELLPVAKLKGDADAGKLVFKNNCAKCHSHGGEGERIGPDLTGMAVHPKEELLTQIIDPSRSVEGNFRVYTAATSSGLVLTGLLTSESKTAIEMVDTEGRRTSILRADLEELVASPKSLMPDGFEKQVGRQDLANLLEFLTRRGAYLPLPLDKQATIVSTRGMLQDGDVPSERLTFDDWRPKTFEGVPFHPVDPREGRVPNLVMLHSSRGTPPPKMPRSVSLPCNTPAEAIHPLSGVSAWGYPDGQSGSVSMIVRLHYADGQAEDHPLANGEHFADFARRIDVPSSRFAFDLHGRQIRYLVVKPKKPAPIERIELVKGRDDTAPIVMAVTVELPAGSNAE